MAVAEVEAFNVLGLPFVEESMTEAAVKDAYRYKVRECHPDAGGSPEAFRKVQEAKDFLLRPEASIEAMAKVVELLVAAKVWEWARALTTRTTPYVIYDYVQNTLDAYTQAKGITRGGYSSLEFPEVMAIILFYNRYKDTLSYMKHRCAEAALPPSPEPYKPTPEFKQTGPRSVV